MATFKASHQLNMLFSSESSIMEQGEAVLLSLHPQHAQRILSGEKKLEFRRAWARRQVSLVVIYVTVPVKKIVGVAKLKKVHFGSPATLWNLAKSIGGGLSKQDLYNYFQGRRDGFAIELGDVQQFAPALDPEDLIKGFRAPQSFSYLDEKSVTKLGALLLAEKTRGRVIFVAGVHGVGKTTLCQNLAVTKGLTHKSASQLIRETKASAIAANKKTVIDIQGNQKILIDAVQKFRSTGQTLLLDGHFALLDVNGHPQLLPKQIFADLGVTDVIAIHDKPSVIAERLGQRDGIGLTVKQLTALQKLELSQANRVCSDLCIPFRSVKSTDKSAFDQLVSALI